MVILSLCLYHKQHVPVSISNAKPVAECPLKPLQLRISFDENVFVPCLQIDEGTFNRRSAGRTDISRKLSGADMYRCFPCEH